MKEAVDQAVDECIRQGILAEFLQQNRAEVTKMGIFEYDEEKVKRLLRKDAYEDGQAKGIIETSLEHGASEQEILERLQNKLDISPQIAKEYFDKLSQPIKQFAFTNNLWYNVDVGEMGQLLTVLSDSADMWLDMRNYCDRAYQAQKES